MQVVSHPHDLPAEIPYPVLAIGVFDGLHLGHQEILRGVVHRARERRGTSILLSFTPHPQKVISSGDAPRLLQTSEQKREILRHLGIDFYIRLPFTRRLSLYSPDEFVARTLAPVKVREVHVGRNFRFGHRRSGDFNTLQELGNEYSFKVFGVDAVHFRGQRISSTRIRHLLEGGRVELAGRLLGRPYEIRGTVIRGSRLGTDLGFPTANIKSENELTPGTGIYAGQVSLDRERFLGAVSIGYRPTIHPANQGDPVIEAYLIDYDGNLYGRRLQLRFCAKLRDEEKFSNLDQLRERIAVDVRRIRKYYNRSRSLWEDRSAN